MATDSTALRVVTPMDEDAAAGALAHVLGTGDLYQLTNEQRVAHYLNLCRSCGLSPLSRPYQWIEFRDGDNPPVLTLYVKPTAAAQALRNNHVSVSYPRREIAGELFVCEAHGKAPDGREGVGTKYVPLTGKYGRLTGRHLANALMSAECVPVESEILTRDGWRTYDHLVIGQEVLAYDLETDSCRWTPLQAVTVYDEALTIRVGNADRGFRCTTDHSWVVEHPAYRPDQRGDGSRGPRGTYASRRPLRQLLEASRVSKSDRIVLAAPAPGGDHALTPQEAAILGWIMTDGSIRRRASTVRCTIYQSKPDRIEEIEQLVAAVGYHPTRVTIPATTRDFTGVGRYGGGVSDCLPQRRWMFSTYESSALFAKAGIADTTDMVSLVTRLSLEARAAMLSAMMAGDGDARGNFGTKTKSGVMEAWEILATLQGYALGSLSPEDRDVRVRRLRAKRVLHGMNLTITDPAVERVWCPTTAYGTWVMRQAGEITITGNTGAMRRLALNMGLVSGPDPDEGQIVRTVYVDGTGAILDQPTEEQRHLAEHPAVAAAIGEPTFETTVPELPDDDMPNQRPRPEEYDPPRPPRRPASFRHTEADVKKLLGAWFAAVKESSLDDDEGRHGYVRAYTASMDPPWPQAKQTDSLRTFFARATEREAGDLLAHVRAMVEDEKRANAEALAAHRQDEPSADEDDRAEAF